MATYAYHAPAPASYTVKRGDTLSQIALDFLGNANDWPSVWKDNPQIANPNLIYAGDKVHLNASHVSQMPPAAYHRPKHAAPPQPTFTPHMTAHTPKHSAAPRPVPRSGVPAPGNMPGIAAFFEAHGASRAAAAGVAACIWGESEGNPESIGSGGFGLIGWTGNNLGLPNGYFGPTGNVAYDMAVQLQGVVGYVNANGGWGPINAAGGPVGAAQVFSSRYERPAVLYSDIHYGGAGDPTLIFNAI